MNSERVQVDGSIEARPTVVGAAVVAYTAYADFATSPSSPAPHYARLHSHRYYDIVSRCHTAFSRFSLWGREKGSGSLVYRVVSAVQENLGP